MNIFNSQKKLIFILFLFLSSILVNQYYGNLGVQPIDSFFPFNSGFDIYNGFYPFKDYWTITGPFIDVVQALFFKLFGVSWFSYVLHASIFNFIFVIFFFYTLSQFNLDIKYCFLYSFFLSLLSYPSSGTPYVDHQASYLSVMGVFCFLLALKKENNLWWFILPIILGLSFLTKQTPTGYVSIILVLFSLIYFIFNFDFKKILSGIFGTIFILSLFLLFIFIGEIPLKSFFHQYILFPLSFGQSRLEDGFLFPLEFQRIILRFKLIHLSGLLLIIIIFKNISKNFKYLINYECISILTLVSLTFIMIAHQLMTINGLFIYFLIPILISFSHIYHLKYFKDKTFILYFLVFLSFSSTIYYGYKYINKRNFADLQNANFSKAIDAKYLNKKLSGLKWITPQYDEPKVELSNLKNSIEIIKNDNSNIAIVTDYQFISVVLSTYDNSPNKVWYSFHVYPSKTDEYFNYYQDFFIKKIIERKIQSFYTVKPLYGDKDVLIDILDKSCYEKVKINEILEKHLIKKCKQLENFKK